MRTNVYFDEIQVYEGIAERTGTTVDRNAVRGSKTACNSIPELGRKARRMGDGHFYLAGQVWPPAQTRINLLIAWTPIQ